MKKELKTLLSILLATSCCATAIAFTGCDKDKGNGNDNPNPPIVDPGDPDNPDDPDDPDDPQEDEWTLSVTGQARRTVDLSSDNESLVWSVRKNGTVVTDEEVLVELTGDSVTFDESTHKITPVELGETTVKLTLKNHPDVTRTVIFDVHDYFFSHDSALGRGSVDFTYEDDDTEPYVTVSGGQASVLVKKASTAFVFNCKMSVGSDTILANSSFGVASFLQQTGDTEAGNRALWFGLRKGATGTDGVFSQYKRVFYGGWNNCEREGADEGYIDLNTGKDEIDFTIIRDGGDYYYSINGYYGTYHTDTEADTPTYAGVYSQEIALELTDYSYTDDADAIALAIKENYTDRSYASVQIKEAYLNELVKGESAQYTADAFPKKAGEGAPVLSWELDKSEMTAGADGTDVANGLLTLADDAAGYVTLICKVPDTTVEKRVRIEILQQAKLQENDRVSAKGGVILNNGDTDDWSITFPEYYAQKNGVSNSSDFGKDNDKYVETLYCAVLKDRVTRDFALQFKIKDYIAATNSPKLQVSLGADQNNFYLVYDKTARRFRIEAWVQGTREMANNAAARGWYSTEWITDFDPAAEHTIRIEVTNRGLYVVYVDDMTEELAFCERPIGDPVPATISRYNAFTDNTSIKFGTQNCSVTISDIEVTNGTCEIPAFMSDHQALYSENDESFTMAMLGMNDWAYTQWSDYQMRYMRELPANFTMTFDVEFSDAMTDGKLGMHIGNNHIQFNNGNGTMSVTTVLGNDNRGINWGTKTDMNGLPVIDGNPYLLRVRIERNGNSLRVIVNDKAMPIRTDFGTATNLDFYTFCLPAAFEADGNKTIDVTSFAVGNYEAKEYLTIEAASPTLSFLSTDTEHKAVGYTVKSDTGEVTTLTPEQLTERGLTVEYVLSDDTYVKLDANNALYVDGDPTDTVNTELTISLKNGATVIDTATVAVTVSFRSVENSVITPIGGVEFDYEGNDPETDWSVTFPTSKMGTDGVVDEHKYADAAYSANFKNKIKGDTTVEFELTNYTSQGESPKFMVSMGGTHNQLYFVYKAGSGLRLEVVIPRVNTNYGYWEDDGWLQSDWISGFDPVAGGKFKIELKGGVYTVYHMFGGETEYIPFVVGEINDGTLQIGSHTMATSYTDYIVEKNMRMATKDAAVTVSNISVTTGTVQTFYKSTALSSYDGSNLVIKAHKDGWQNETSHGDLKWKDRNSAHYTGEFTSSQTATFDLKFDTAMTDGKFAINIGGNNFYVENKVKGEHKINLCGNGDWSDHSIAATDVGTVIKLTVVRNGDSVAVTMAIGTESVTFTNTAPADKSSLYFWMFNSNESEQNATVTVSNLVISNN